MADKYIRRTDASGDTVREYALGGTGFIPYQGNGGSYVVFAKITAQNTGSSMASILVAGVGRVLDNSSGLFLLQIRYSNRAIANVQVNQLVAPTRAVEFGYYMDGNTAYIGVYRSMNYASALSATLMGYDPNGAIKYEVGNFYAGTTQPTGWTQLTIS